MVRAYSILSIVRLKRVESIVDTGMKQGSLLPVGLVRSTDREDNLRSDFIELQRLQSGLKYSRDHY
jgi:hypothetical protein